MYILKNVVNEKNDLNMYYLVICYINYYVIVVFCV